MGLNVKGGTFNSPTSTGNVSVTGVGFTPKLLILYTTLATDASGMSPYWGAGTSSSARWSAACTAVKTLNANAYRMFDSSKIVRLTTEVGADFITADLVSLDSDGFTLNWSLTQAPGFPFNYLCIGGTDFSAKVGFFDSNTSAGNQSITGVGFRPKAVMAASVDVPSLDGVGFSTANLSVGAGTDVNVVACVATGADPVVAGNTSSYGDTGVNLWELINSASVFGAGSFISNDGDGFTVNVNTVTSATALRIGYIALGGTARYFLSTLTQPTSTGNQAITGVGFTPSVDIFWSGGRAAGVFGVNARFMFGASISSSDRGVIWSSQLNNSGAPAESRATLRTKSIDLVTDNSTTVLADADFVSQNSDGFTNNWTTADATVRVVSFLSIGAATIDTGALDFLPITPVRSNRSVNVAY